MAATGTYQVVGHRVDVRRDLFPSARQTGNICLAAHDTVDADVLGHSLHFIAENGQPVNHVVDDLLQNEYLALRFNLDLPAHVTLGNGLGHSRDVSHLVVSQYPVPLVTE